MKKIIFCDLLLIAVRLGFLPVLCLTRGPWALDLLRIHVSTHSLLPFSLCPPVFGGWVGLSVGRVAFQLSDCSSRYRRLSSLPSFLLIRRSSCDYFSSRPSSLVCWLCVVIPRYPHCSGGGGRRRRRRRRQRPLKVVCSDRVCKGSVFSNGALTKEDSTVAVGVCSLLSRFMYHKSA